MAYIVLRALQQERAGTSQECSGTAGRFQDPAADGATGRRVQLGPGMGDSR